MLKNTKIVTFLIIPLFLLAVLIYDVVAIMMGGTEASISSLIINLSYKMPFAVYITGLLNGIFVGHLFWRMRSNESTKSIDNY